MRLKDFHAQVVDYGLRSDVRNQEVDAIPALLLPELCRIHLHRIEDIKLNTVFYIIPFDSLKEGLEPPILDHDPEGN